MVTPAVFLGLYPEFTAINADSAVTTAIVQNSLDYADAFLSDTAFGTLRNHAAGLLVAHRLCIRYSPTIGALQAQAKPGIENSQNVGPGAVSFGVAHSRLVESENAWQADLSRTNYGLELLSLMDSSIAPMAIAGTADSAAGDPVGPIAGPLWLGGTLNI